MREYFVVRRGDCKLITMPEKHQGYVDPLIRRLQASSERGSPLRACLGSITPSVMSAGIDLQSSMGKDKDTLPGAAAGKTEPQPSGRLYYLPSDFQESEPQLLDLHRCKLCLCKGFSEPKH